MCKRLNSFIGKNNISSNVQFGFRQGNSTEFACHTFLNTIQEAMENNHQVVELFLDLTKAYDILNHQTLLDLSHVQIVLYADDINILIIDKDENGLKEKITLLLNCKESWFRNNILILNIKKSCALLFHPRLKIRVCKPRIIYNDQLIPYKTDVKFLGIQITEQLSWNTHVKFICPNLNKASFIIKTLKETSYKITRLIYYSYFQSRLKYGIIFWGAAKESINVFQIQKQVIRLIVGVNKRTSCRSIFRKYRILTLPSLYILVSLSFIKKLNDNLEYNSQKYHYSTKR
jgi:hypothetical protein